MHTNELQKLSKRVGAYFEVHGSRILMVLSAVVVVAAVVTYWVRSSGATVSDRSTQLVLANSPEDYAEVADNFSGTVVGAWAKLNEAEGNLSSGIRLSFSDRKAAVSDLKKAREGFAEVTRQKGLPDILAERAAFSNARCLETLTGVEIDRDEVETKEAIAAYQYVVDKFPDSIYKELAQNRIADLNSDEAVSFYKWYRAQNPKPGDFPGPQDFNFSPGHPSLDSPMLPEIPEELQLPKSLDAAAPPEGSSDGNTEGPSLSAPGNKDKEAEAGSGDPQKNDTSTEPESGKSSDSPDSK